MASGDGRGTLRRVDEVEINSSYGFADKSNPFLLFALSFEDMQCGVSNTNYNQPRRPDFE